MYDLETTGKSPDKLIDDCVMREIRISLADFSTTISRISDDMGFPSPSFFGKYIKRLTGLSPRELRRQLYWRQSGTPPLIPHSTC